MKAVETAIVMLGVSAQRRRRVGVGLCNGVPLSLYPTTKHEMSCGTMKPVPEELLSATLSDLGPRSVILRPPESRIGPSRNDVMPELPALGLAETNRHR